MVMAVPRARLQVIRVITAMMMINERRSAETHVVVGLSVGSSCCSTSHANQQ